MSDAPTKNQPENSSITVWKPGRHCLELDGVRGIAILMVTLYRFAKEVDPSAHPVIQFAQRFAPIGERGVDLFFVLSGFLITSILLQTKSSEGYFFNFFLRRSLRIFPLYFTALAICLWFIPFFFSPSPFDLPRTQQTYLWTYLTNIRMSWLNQWTFGPLDHFWSLAVEEHFYLVWPVVVFLLTTKAMLRFSVLTILVVGVARVIASTRPEMNVAVDVLTIFRCDSLCFGAILAAMLNMGTTAKTMERIANISLIPMLVVLSAIAVTQSRVMTLASSLCPAVWMVLLGLLLTRPQGQLMSRLTKTGFLRWLGKYSYGMYVVQLPLLSIITTKMAIDFLSTLTSNRLVIFLAYIPMMFSITMLLGYLSYHGLEKHFLRLKPRP